MYHPITPKLWVLFLGSLIIAHASPQPLDTYFNPFQDPFYRNEEFIHNQNKECIQRSNQIVKELDLLTPNQFRSFAIDNWQSTAIKFYNTKYSELTHLFNLIPEDDQEFQALALAITKNIAFNESDLIDLNDEKKYAILDQLHSDLLSGSVMFNQYSKGVSIIEMHEAIKNHYVSQSKNLNEIPTSIIEPQKQELIIEILPDPDIIMDASGPVGTLDPFPPTE